MLSYDQRRAGMAALAAAARAFALAQSKGYVWVSDDGAFLTCEESGRARPLRRPTIPTSSD